MDYLIDYIYKVSLYIKDYNNFILNYRLETYEVESVREKLAIILYYMNVTKQFLSMVYMYKNIGQSSSFDKEKNIRTFLLNRPKIIGRYLDSLNENQADMMFSVTPSFTFGVLRFIWKKDTTIKVILNRCKKQATYDYFDITTTLSSYSLPVIIVDYENLDIKKHIEICNNDDVCIESLNIVKFIRYLLTKENGVEKYLLKNNLTITTLSSDGNLLSRSTYLDEKHYGTTSMYRSFVDDRGKVINYKSKDIIHDYKDQENYKIVNYSYNKDINDVEIIKNS